MSAVVSAVGGAFGGLFGGVKAPKINVGQAVAAPVRVSDAALSERTRRRAGGSGFEANILSGGKLGSAPAPTAPGTAAAGTGGVKQTTTTLGG